jgi:hypothetical protein
VIQFRAGKFSWARKIEFRRDRNGWCSRNEIRVGFVVFFCAKLQHRIARTRQTAHKIRVNPEARRHDFRPDILEFERGHKIGSIQRVRDPHRAGERKIEIRKVSRIHFTLERVTHLFDAPRPIANITVLRAPIWTCGTKSKRSPTKFEFRILDPI